MIDILLMMLHRVCCRRALPIRHFCRDADDDEHFMPFGIEFGHLFYRFNVRLIINIVILAGRLGRLRSRNGQPAARKGSSKVTSIILAFSYFYRMPFATLLAGRRCLDSIVSFIVRQIIFIFADVYAD